MSFSWATFRRPIVALAPMAGVTDASFRQLIKKVDPGILLYTEFLSSDAITYGAKKTLKMLEFDATLEKPLIVQIFGADPKKFLEACKIIEQMGADGIDINMGCPAAKIVSSCYGSALIRRPDLATEVVNSAVRAVSIPISVKTRLGWDTHETLIPFCKKLEEAGASAFAIHGRRYHDKFTGRANWEPIYKLKKAVKVPVLGNGDIASAEDALRMIGNLDGVMVGRATWGNPWLMKEISEALLGRQESEEGQKVQESPQSGSSTRSLPEMHAEKLQIFQKRIPFILEHYDIAIKLKGETRGVLEMRRHMSSYVKGFDGARDLRARILQLESLAEVKEALKVISHKS